MCWKCVFLFNVHSNTSCFWLLHFCIYIYIYISNWIIGYIFTYNYLFIHSKCKFNVDLYWIIRNAIIYCKYTLKFSVFKVIDIFLWYTFLPIRLPLTYKTYEGYSKPENLVFCYQPISMPNNITRQYQTRIKNSVKLLQWSSFTKIDKS